MFKKLTYTSILWFLSMGLCRAHGFDYATGWKILALSLGAYRTHAIHEDIKKKQRRALREAILGQAATRDTLVICYDFLDENPDIIRETLRRYATEFFERFIFERFNNNKVNTDSIQSLNFIAGIINGNFVPFIQEKKIRKIVISLSNQQHDEPGRAWHNSNKQQLDIRLNINRTCTPLTLASIIQKTFTIGTFIKSDITEAKKLTRRDPKRSRTLAASALIHPLIIGALSSSLRSCPKMRLLLYGAVGSLIAKSYYTSIRNILVQTSRFNSLKQEIKTAIQSPVLNNKYENQTLQIFHTVPDLHVNLLRTQLNSAFIARIIRRDPTIGNNIIPYTAKALYHYLNQRDQDSFANLADGYINVFCKTNNIRSLLSEARQHALVQECLRDIPKPATEANAFYKQ